MSFLAIYLNNNASQAVKKIVKNFFKRYFFLYQNFHNVGMSVTKYLKNV